MLEDDSPFYEDVGLSNLKLFIGFGSVGASVVSHIYPAPFPKNWWVLAACCAWYFIGSGLLQLLLSFVELESIVLLRYKDKARRGARASGINVSSHFMRYQNVYTLGVTPLPSGSLALFSAPKFKPNPSVDGELPPADYAQIHWSGEARTATGPPAARRAPASWFCTRHLKSTRHTTDEKNTRTHASYLVQWVAGGRRVASVYIYVDLSIHLSI